jgi:hypothetical protein
MVKAGDHCSFVRINKQTKHTNNKQTNKNKKQKTKQTKNKQTNKQTNTKRQKNKTKNLIFQNIQTNTAVAVDVWMINASCKSNLRRFERIAVKKTS